MTNDFFNFSSEVSRNTLIRSSKFNSEFIAVEAGFDKLPSQTKMSTGTTTFAEDTGSANAVVIAMSPALSSYTDGFRAHIRLNATNTGASTIDAGPGTRGLKAYNGDDLAAGDLTSGEIVEVVYDGDNNQFVLMGPGRSDFDAAGASATAAAASAAAAATSETNAGTSETNAATSETNAATSETNAANSASAASTSESNAATSETNAGTSETNAASSASAASTSETNAGTSETNAASSASAASTSETNAATSETSAGNSATAATAAQTAAETAETNAEAAQAAAEAAADSVLNGTEDNPAEALWFDAQRPDTITAPGASQGHLIVSNGSGSSWNNGSLLFTVEDDSSNAHEIPIVDIDRVGVVMENYNSYTDQSNYEMGRLVWYSNKLHLETVSAGSGQSRDLLITSESDIELSAYGGDATIDLSQTTVKLNGAQVVRMQVGGSSIVDVTGSSFEPVSSGIDLGRDGKAFGRLYMGALDDTDGNTTPNAGECALWLATGSGSDGDDGDLMCTITDSGGTTKTVTLIDFSAM